MPLTIEEAEELEFLELKAKIAKAQKQPAEQPKGNDPGFLGIDNFMRGVGRIPELFDLGEKGGEARGQFAKGAGNALQATGRGVASIGGQITEDALINAPIAAIDTVGDALSGKNADISRSFSEARKQGDRLEKEQGGAKFVGEVISGSAISKKLTEAGIKSLIKQGAIFGAANSAGDDLAQGKLDIQDIASDAALGGIIGGVGEKVAPIVAKAAQPVVNTLGNISARVAQPFEVAARKLTGTKGQSSAGKMLDSLKLDKDGPVTPKSLRMIAGRHAVDDKVLQDAVDEFRLVNQREPNLIEVADPETMRKFAMLAYERKSMGAVMRDAQEAQLRGLPQELDDAVRASGPVQSAVRTNRALDASETSKLNRIDEASDGRQGVITTQADEAVARTNLDKDALVDDISEQARADARVVRDAGDDEAFELMGRAGDDAANIRARASDEALNLRDEAADQATNLTRKAEEDVVSIQDRVAPALARAEGVQRIARADVTDAAAIDKKNSFYSERSPVTEWGNKAMRESGLADRTVQIEASEIKDLFPKERVEDILGAMKDAVPENFRTPLGTALVALKEGKQVVLTVGDADILRRAFRNAAEDPKYFKLNEAADKLEQLVGKQHGEYNKFVSDYAKLRTAAEQMRKINSVLGSKADVPLLRDVMLDRETRAAIKEIMGKDGDNLLKSIDQSMDNLDAMTKQVEDIERAAANQIKAVKRNAQDASKEVKTAGRDDARAVTAEAGKDAAVVSSTARVQGRQIRRETRSEADAIGSKSKKEIASARRDASEKIESITKKRDADVAAVKGRAKALAASIKDRYRIARQAVEASGNVLSRGTGEFAASIEGASKSLPLGAVARGSISDAASKSASSAAKTTKSLSEPATRDRLAMIDGEANADRLQAIGRTQQKAIANMSSVTPQEGFGTKAVSGEISAALDVAAGLAGRPGPGYIAKLSKGFLGFTRKLGMTSAAATDLAVAVTRRDAKAMRQIISSVARTGAQQKQIASAIRAAMQSMTNSEE